MVTRIYLQRVRPRIRGMAISLAIGALTIPLAADINNVVHQRNCGPIHLNDKALSYINYVVEELVACEHLNDEVPGFY